MTITIIALVLIYITWRVWIYLRAKQKYLSLLPPENRLTWASHSSVTLDTPLMAHPLQADAPTNTTDIPDILLNEESTTESKQTAHSNIDWAAASDGLLQGLPVFHSFMNVDANVLDAIEFSTRAKLDSLQSLHDYIEEKYFRAASESAEGWFNRLVGYVGEQKAAAALQQLGHRVEFPLSPNNESWDLLVDGEPYNVKVGVHALRAGKEHLANHPDGGIILSDAFDSTVVDDNVILLPNLEIEGVSAATQDTLEGLKDGIDPDFDFPWVTFVMSTFREFRLLLCEKTNLERALQHIGVDVAAVGLGGFSGAKIGAFIGSILGPIGAGVCGLLGSIIGAVGGKVCANAFRYGSFNQAKAEYFTTANTAREELNKEIERARESVKELQGYYEQQFIDERNRTLSYMEERLSTARAKHLSALQNLAQRFPERLLEIVEQLKSEEAVVVATVPRSPLGFVWPSDSDLLRWVIRWWFRRARRIVKRERKQFVRHLKMPISQQITCLRGFLDRYEVSLASLASDIEEVVRVQELVREEGENIRNECVLMLKQARCELLRRFQLQTESIVGRITKLASEWREKIDRCRQKLFEEAAAVGLDERLRSVLGL